MNLFENIYYDLLVEGKSPEEILSILKYKFKNVPEVIIDNVFNIDPTKKKSYTQWVLMHYDNEKHIVDNALQNGMLKKLFSYVQSHQDVQLAKYQTIEDALYLVSNIDLLSKDSGDELENDFDIVYKTPEWVIAVPNTYEADHKLGENTDWCTAGYKYNNGRGYYDRYLSEYGGKYFVNFDFRNSEHLDGVDYPFKRYQFHFESNQFMDAKDTPIDGESIDIPNGVINYYNEEGYDTEKLMENEEEKYERYDRERFDDGVRINDDLWILQAFDENLEFEENGRYYYVYDINVDDRDTFCWEEVTKDPLYLDAGNEIIILNKNTSDATRYEGNLAEFNNTKDCEPIIIYQNDGASEWTYATDIIYYKVMELYGETFVAFITTAKTGSEFWIINKNKIVDEPLQFEVNSGVLGMYVNDEAQAIYGSYDSEFLIEVIWTNGYHTLFNITSYHNADTVVSADVPVDGAELFTVGEDENGDSVILGTLRNYYGDDLRYHNSNGKSKTPKHFIENLNYKGFIIVQMADGEYNVYNKDTKQIIFEENFHKILGKSGTEYKWFPIAEDYGVIIGYKAESESNPEIKAAIYSLDTGKQLTPSFTVIQHFVNSDIFGAQNDRYENYIINAKTFKIFGPYYGLTPYAYKNKIFVKPSQQSGNKLLNIDTGEIEFQNLSNLTYFNNRNNLPIMFALESHGQCVMVNYDTGDILDSGIMLNKKPQEVYGLDNYVILRYSTSGKENIVSMIDGTKLLPNDVSEISNNCQYVDYDISHKTAPGYIAFKDNNTEYILHLTEGGNELLPTSNGITTGETTGIWNYRLNYTSCICFTIHDSKETPEIRVMYNFIQNNVFVEDNRGVAKILKTCEPEIQQRVMQAINPQRHQVVSQYNEMINRMKKLLR